MQFTRKGYIEVWLGEVFVSRHTSAEEAYESAYAHAESTDTDEALYVIRYPHREMDLSRLKRYTRQDQQKPTTPVLTATASPPTTVELSWTAATDNVSVAGYRLYYSLDQVNWTLLYQGTTRDYSHTGLGEDTYYYRVNAYDPTGNNGDYATANATLDLTAPTTPNLVVESTTSSTVSLSWTASTDNVGVRDYTLQRSTDNNSWTTLYSGLNRTYSDTGLSASTLYYYRVRARDTSGNASAWASASAQTANVAWLTVPDFTFTEGTASRQSFAAYAPSGATSFTLSPDTPGITVDSDTKELVYDGVTAATTYTNRVLSSNTSQSEDWLDRINDPLVVWYHNFDSAAEVNAFRWTGNYGNDPNAIGRQDADLVRWVETGGADGGGYLEIYRPAYAAGTTRYVDGVHWWRPFSALTGASNGRGEDDPAADGTLPVGTLIATNGGSQTYNWTNSGNPNQGWYGHSSVQNSYFDGGDFWLQVRVMADPRRTTNPAVKVGKFSSFTTTRASYTTQELVTYSGYWSGATSSAYAGMPNVHNVYQGYGYQELASVSTGSPRNPSSASPWSYSFGWDTLLYHVSPGRQATNETVFQVWAARSGETSYTLIWDVVYPAYYSADATLQQGWNAFLCWIYQISDEDNQGYYNSSAFYQRYDQIIFKKGNGGSDPNTDGIRCPQV